MNITILLINICYFRNKFLLFSIYRLDNKRLSKLSLSQLIKYKKLFLEVLQQKLKLLYSRLEPESSRLKPESSRLKPESSKLKPENFDSVFCSMFFYYYVPGSRFYVPGSSLRVPDSSPRVPGSSPRVPGLSFYNIISRFYVPGSSLRVAVSSLISLLSVLNNKFPVRENKNEIRFTKLIYV